MTPSDPRYYYLANFERALAWISQRYDDLLEPDEAAFLCAFSTLPLAARAVLVRMLMRRGDVFRTSRLVYEEIGDSSAAIAPLIALGWVDVEAELPLDVLFALLTKPELAAVFGSAISPSARKSDWLEQLGASNPIARTYAQWCPDASDAVVHVAIAPLCERLRLMFFGNLFQEWSEFVLADLGIFQYERVEFDAASRAFQRRDDIDTYLQIQHCGAALDAGDAVDFEAVFAAAESARSDNPWLETRRAKLLFQIGQLCERAHDWPRALHAYRQSNWPGSRHRLIRVLERSERYDDAWPLALEALATPQNDEEYQRVGRMMARLRRHATPGRCAASNAALPMPAMRARAPIQRTDLSLPRPTDGTRVEWAVLSHLQRDDAPVHYVENTLVNTLFGLLCWPAVFEPLPGAFFHPFQSGPADLHAPDFHARRAAAFDACLTQLDTDAYRASILARFESKFGLQSPFVAWNSITRELLGLALDCMPAVHLKRCFERLLSGLKTNRSGLPDLIQFFPNERRYTLIEVKGPGDRLQDNQVRWIDYCAAHGIPVEVVHVQWLDAYDHAPHAPREAHETREAQSAHPDAAGPDA